MLDYIRIRNLRSLHDTGEIKINPITILLGENSSGKSTFLRAFPLLKQSVETNTRSSILWYGKYVDFGDFDQALNRYNNEKEISFTFGLTVPKLLILFPGHWQRNFRKENPLKETKIVVEIRLASRGKDGLTRTAGLHLSIADNEIDIEINDQGKISAIHINDSDYSEYAELFSYSQATRILPEIFSKLDPEENVMYPRWRSKNSPRKIQHSIFKTLRSLMHGRSGAQAINQVYSRLYAGGKSEMLSYFKRASSTITWQRRTADMQADAGEFKEIRDLILLSKIPALLPDFDYVLDATFRRISYTAPLRASAERYYRSQDLSVSELDSKGENLAMFVRNLTEREKQNLDSWTKKEFGLTFEVKYSGGHVTAGIAYEGSGERFNLADMGFGFSQVMPIIVQVWTLINKPQKALDEHFAYTYLIEQPELHLHPRLQAKLAEALIRAVMRAKDRGIKINLIFETHSEAIVNKIGLMMAAGEISGNEANIIIFSKENERSKTRTTVSHFDDSGLLKNWPYGFFDIEV